ncbi:MAG: hypothetical protein R2822_16570 [Spirosomataceae bacterium]
MEDKNGAIWFASSDRGLFAMMEKRLLISMKKERFGGELRGWHVQNKMGNMWFTIKAAL